MREEELIGLLAELPTLFKFPTALGFLLCALAYRVAHRRTHARREPRTVQHSRGARFRIALVKACSVILGAGTVFEVEFTIVSASTGGVEINLFTILAPGTLGLTVGIVAAIEVVVQPSRFRP